jgi:CRP/FNR family transcriptional regulator
VNIPEQFNLLFEPKLLAEFKDKATPHYVKEGDTILDIGQTVRVMPVIVSGVVKISRMDDDGHEIFLYYVNPNESCAMTFTCCMQQHASEIKAVAQEDVEFLAVPISVMDEWMIKYSTWKGFVMNTIRVRFNELLKTIDQIAFQKLDERLIHYLKEKSNATGSSLINQSHEQIANDLASSREVISRLLKQLEKDNKVLLYRHQIKLLQDL